MNLKQIEKIEKIAIAIIDHNNDAKFQTAKSKDFTVQAKNLYDGCEDVLVEEFRNDESILKLKDAYYYLSFKSGWPISLKWIKNNEWRLKKN